MAETRARFGRDVPLLPLKQVSTLIEAGGSEKIGAPARNRTGICHLGNGRSDPFELREHKGWANNSGVCHSRQAHR
jgi:hypothetical protein